MSHHEPGYVCIPDHALRTPTDGYEVVDPTRTEGVEVDDSITDERGAPLVRYTYRFRDGSVHRFERHLFAFPEALELALAERREPGWADPLGLT